MKRVFQVSEITQLCKDIKSILEQCKEHVSAMRTYADQAGEALEAVPYEARYGIAVHDVSQKKLPEHKTVFPASGNRVTR